MVNTKNTKNTKNAQILKEPKDQRGYWGDKTPQTLRDGPLKERRCTDALCMVIFLVFWGGLIGIGYYSYINGDPEALSYPFDHLDNQCGVGSLEGYPYLYYIRSGRNFSVNSTVCITDCPDDDTNALECDPAFGTHNCSELQIYASDPLVDRFCIPTVGDYAQTLDTSSALDFGFMFQAMSDLQAAWWMIIVVGIVALCIGFLYLILLKYFSGLLVWGLVVIFILLVSMFGLLCLEDAGGTGDLEDITPGDLASLDPLYLQMIAYLCFIVSFGFLVLVCCYRSKINLSIAILKAATDFLDDHSELMVMPLFFLITNVTFYVGWIYYARHIVGLNDISPSDDHFAVGKIGWNAETIAMFAYYIFAIFWNHLFGIALAQFIVASTACLWYFKQGKSNAGESLFWISIKRGFLHFGSIALGSLLIGIFGVINVILNYLHNKIRALPDEEGENRKGLGALCCGCYLDCFEKSFKFINRFSYIQIAMTGAGFCKATHDSYFLLVRNKTRFGMVHGLAWIFLSIGQLFIPVCSTLLGYIWITQTDYFSDKIYSPVSPSIFFFLTSWAVTRIFMSVYGISADTIIQCFAMDEEMNEGFAEHAPKQLREFVDDTLHKKLLFEDK